MLFQDKKVRLAGAAVLLAVLLVYANSFNNSFHFDDFHTITDNPAVRSLRNVPRFFTDATTFSVLPANRTYRPVVSTSLALDYALGRGYIPFWFHLSTLCWFVVLLWMMFRLCAAMFQRADSEAPAAWLALFATAWFGLHPAMAETVNYVIQRGDLYCTLGCVAALVLYVDHPAHRRAGIYLLPLALALLSKPPAAIFPVLLLTWVFFFEVVPGEKPSVPTRWRNAFLAALPALILVVLLMTLQSARTPKTFTPTILDAAAYRLTQPYVWLRYCAELFFPIHLNVDTDLSPFSHINGRLLAGWAFLLGMLFAIWRTAQERRFFPLAFALIWFVVTQLPTSLYPLSEVENDHRVFFSFVGLIPGVVWGAWLLLERLDSEVRKRMTPMLTAAALLSLCAYPWGAHVRNSVWHDEESLWRDDVEKSPHNGRGLMIYGLTQMNKGEYTSALDLYSRALLYTPNYATLEINLGVVNGLLGNQAEAERHFRRAVLLQPNDDQPHTYYGRWLTARGRAPEAVEQLRLAVTLNPQRLLQRQLLIEALRNSGDPEGAKQAAAALAAAFPGEAVALAASPQAAAYWINLSLEQYRAGAWQESIVSARHALEFDPRSAAAYNNIGAALGAMRQWQGAVANEQKALALDPGLQIARNNLQAFLSRRDVADASLQGSDAAFWVNRSLALNQQGQYEESIAAAQRALELDAGSAVAWNNIAASYEAMHRWDQAIEAAHKAILLKPDFQLAKNNLAWSEQQKRATR